MLPRSLPVPGAGRRALAAVLIALLIMAGFSPVAYARQVIIKLGTIAPEGSSWHDALLEVRQGWKRLTNGEVELRIYAGGVLGGEAEMVRKVQRGGLDAITISGAGLSFIDKNVECLNLPLLFDSYEELDYVREGVAPKLELSLERRKFKVLNWAEAGWMFFFSTRPIRTPADLRSRRLWITSGMPEIEKLFKGFDFKVVPLPVTEMQTALQTGLIDAIDVPPLFALLDGSYRLANYMTNLKWSPLNAATVISTRKWQAIPEAYRVDMLEIAQKAARELRAENRRASEQAVTEMVARGLTVVTLTEEEIAAWRAEAKTAFPKLRGSMIPRELFDEVMRLHDEYNERRVSPPP